MFLSDRISDNVIYCPACNILGGDFLKAKCYFYFFFYRVVMRKKKGGR